MLLFLKMPHFFCSFRWRIPFFVQMVFSAIKLSLESRNLTEWYLKVVRLPSFWFWISFAEKQCKQYASFFKNAPYFPLFPIAHSVFCSNDFFRNKIVAKVTNLNRLIPQTLAQSSQNTLILIWIFCEKTMQTTCFFFSECPIFPFFPMTHSIFCSNEF